MPHIISLFHCSTTLLPRKVSSKAIEVLSNQRIADTCFALSGACIVRLGYSRTRFVCKIFLNGVDGKLFPIFLLPESIATPPILPLARSSASRGTAASCSSRQIRSTSPRALFNNYLIKSCQGAKAVNGLQHGNKEEHAGIKRQACSLLPHTPTCTRGYEEYALSLPHTIRDAGVFKRTQDAKEELKLALGPTFDTKTEKEWQALLKLGKRHGEGEE
ncbi:hypothetical protein BT69DRAFT_1294217 [Atractiella rhizophila]|nr:hypothetical protein BT69DRAFT_1294217 [Atractiella rhizophila]